MKFTIKTKLFLIFGLVMQCFCQKLAAQVETEPVQLRNRGKYGAVEEFSIMKTDKTIRQGPYVKYLPTAAYYAIGILETGNYEHGLKEGEWRCFSQKRPWNKLTSKGKYHSDLADDLWLYYWYSPSNSTIPQKVVANPQIGKTGATITLDDTTSIVQAKGVCDAGKRVGMWTFFDRKSVVLQKYNYSTSKLLFSRYDGEGKLSVQELATNHPLLYAGGKGKLSENILESIDQIELLNLGKIGEAEFIFSAVVQSRMI